MEALTAAVAVNAASILLLGIVSGFIKERLWVSEPLIAMLIGLGFGPSGPNLINLHLTQEQELMILREASHLTLAISVMGAALRLPLAYEAKHWRELLAVLLLGMPLMWVVTSGLIWLVLGSGIVLASAIGAVLTPTDPVLADSILTGRLAQQSIPQRMRDSLSAESGANDGLALLLVALPGLVLIAPHDTALLHWVLRGLLQEILGGLLLGLVVGWLFARLTRWAYTKPFTDENSILTSAIALALFVLALGRVLGLAAVFAVFISGLAFNRVQAVHEEAMHERTQAAIARFFDIPIFIYFGAMLPWREWLTLGWGGPVVVVLVLLLRRLPVWLLLRPVTCSLRSNRDAIFNGWFGPIGVGAIYYATEVHEALTNELWVVASLVVFGSIVLHGITATPLIRIYARRAERSSGRRKAAHGHGGTRRGRRGERSPPQAVRRRRRDEV